MIPISPSVYHDIENQFISQFKQYYDIKNEKLLLESKLKLMNIEYPIEFFMFLNKTGRLAKYGIILTKLKPELYEINCELIYNGLTWFKVVYGRLINAYVNKRIKDTNITTWLEIHKNWDKYCKKHHLKF